MLSIGVIIFREVLEISLILGVVLVATRGVAHRSGWVWLGMGVGLAGSVLVAIGAGFISEAIQGMGQEIFNAAVLLSAAGLIAWCVVWMKRHSTALVKRLKSVGQDVVTGKKPLTVLAGVVALAMLREGSEIVLMTYGVLISGQSVAHVVAGSTLGMLAGAAVGAAVYYGLIKVATRHVFAVTGFLLMFLAAGMVSQAIAQLSGAGLIPVLTTPVWDTSRILSERSLVGNVLHTLVGYTSSPSAIQLISYVVTLLVIGILLRLYGGAGARSQEATS